AQLAGARVVVAPTARVRHRRATASGERGRRDAAGAWQRHQLRCVLKNYGARRRLRALSGVCVLALAEVLLALFVPARRHRRGAVAAWRWNRARRASLLTARRIVRETRQLPDRVVISRMVRSRHSQRLAGRAQPDGRGTAGDFAGGGSGDADDVLALGARRPHGYLHADLDRVSEWIGRLQRGELATGSLLAALAVLIFLLVGLRGVLAGPLPVVGDLARLPTGSALLGRFFGGSADPGWSHELSASPPAGALLGLVALVLGNSSAMALKVLLLGGVVIGAIGVLHLLGGISSRRGKATAAVVFVVAPFCWNAIARGDLPACVVLAVFPFLFGRLARASGLLPAPRRSSHPRTLPGWSFGALARDAVVIGLLLALVG
ncbi:MAG: hypothetical protein ACRD0B_11755, partial [Acidimicrobiales bacterium]